MSWDVAIDTIVKNIQEEDCCRYALNFLEDGRIVGIGFDFSTQVDKKNTKTLNFLTIDSYFFCDHWDDVAGFLFLRSPSSWESPTDILLRDSEEFMLLKELLWMKIL